MAKKILFTGLDKAEFKMGNKMIKVVRDAVKEHGKENVTLIHGGRENKSIIDKNIIELGKHTGVKVESDPLDLTQKNAKDIRLQKRIDDPDLEWHSFDRKGNLSLKDKYESWARKTYESLKEEKTYKIGSSKKKSGLGIKYPEKKAKSVGKSTQETSKFKSFLDILEDEPNQQKVESGIKHARKVSQWSDEKFGRPLITEKNQPRLDHIEHGGTWTRMDEYKSLPRPTTIRDKPLFIHGLPTGVSEYTAIENLENPNKTYLETDRDNPNTSGKPKITRIKKGSTSPFTGKDISGKPLSKTMKVNNRGTVLAPRSGVREVTKSFEVRSYGTEGSTYDHKEKKAIPKIQNYTVNETKKISSGSKNPPPKKFVGGPETYSKTSSLTQFEDIEHAEPAEHREAKRKALQDPKYDSDVNIGEDKSSSGKGFERHKREYGKSQQGELNKDITSLIDRVKQIKSIKRKNKRISRTGNKQQFIGTKSPAVKRLTNTVPDVLSYDKQSATVEDVKSPKIYQKLEDTTKTGRDKQIRAEIKKGPNPFGYNTSKEKAMRQNKTGVITAKARNTILTGVKSVRTSGYPSLWRIEQSNVKYPSGFWNPSKNYNKTSKKLPLPKTKVKNVTTEVTPTLKKITSTAKPKKKVVSAASTRGETVATRIQKRFATKPASPNIEYKHRSTDKKHGSVGKGIKFTRGLGAFSLFSSILAPIRGRKEAKQMLKKHGIKRDPSVMETLEHTFLPKHARPKYYKIPDA